MCISSVKLIVIVDFQLWPDTFLVAFLFFCPPLGQTLPWLMTGKHCVGVIASGSLEPLEKGSELINSIVLKQRTWIMRDFLPFYHFNTSFRNNPLGIRTQPFNISVSHTNIGFHIVRFTCIKVSKRTACENNFFLHIRTKP